MRDLVGLGAAISEALYRGFFDHASWPHEALAGTQPSIQLELGP